MNSTWIKVKLFTSFECFFLSISSKFTQVSLHLKFGWEILKEIGTKSAIHRVIHTCSIILRCIQRPTSDVNSTCLYPHVRLRAKSENCFKMLAGKYFDTILKCSTCPKKNTQLKFRRADRQDGSNLASKFYGHRGH